MGWHTFFIRRHLNDIRLFAFIALIVAIAAPSLGSSAPPVKASKSKRTYLWDHWYTVLGPRQKPYAYYHERVRQVGKRIHMETKLYRKVDDVETVEDFGAFATANGNLTPLFFNFHSDTAGHTINIDGLVKNQQGRRLLRVKSETRGSSQPIIRSEIPANAFFSTFFPLWLRLRLVKFKKNQGYRFKTIIEDNKDLGYHPVDGVVALVDDDPVAVRSHTQRLGVKYGDIKATWWVMKSGAAFRIVVPGEQTIIQVVSEAKAKALFR